MNINTELIKPTETIKVNENNLLLVVKGGVIKIIETYVVGDSMQFSTIHVDNRNYCIANESGQLLIQDINNNVLRMIYGNKDLAQTNGTILKISLLDGYWIVEYISGMRSFMISKDNTLNFSDMLFMDRINLKQLNNFHSELYDNLVDHPVIRSCGVGCNADGIWEILLNRKFRYRTTKFRLHNIDTILLKNITEFCNEIINIYNLNVYKIFMKYDWIQSIVIDRNGRDNEILHEVSTIQKTQDEVVLSLVVFDKDWIRRNEVKYSLNDESDLSIDDLYYDNLVRRNEPVEDFVAGDFFIPEEDMERLNDIEMRNALRERRRKVRQQIMETINDINEFMFISFIHLLFF